jgi:hypothetical protein
VHLGKGQTLRRCCKDVVAMGGYVIDRQTQRRCSEDFLILEGSHRYMERWWGWHWGCAVGQWQFFGLISRSGMPLCLSQFWARERSRTPAKSESANVCHCTVCGVRNP